MRKINVNTDINDNYFNMSGFYNQGGTFLTGNTKFGGSGGGGGSLSGCSSPSLSAVCCNSGFTNPNGYPTCPSGSLQSMSTATGAISLGSDPCPYTYNHSNYQCGALIDPEPEVNTSTYLKTGSTGVATGPKTGGGGGGSPVLIYGCTNPIATNYNPSATVDDGSCQLAPPPINGCTDPTAFNYDPTANNDDGSCIPVIQGCANPTAANYNPNANTDCSNNPISNFSGGGYSNMGGCGNYSNFNQQGFGGYNDQLWFND